MIVRFVVPAVLRKVSFWAVHTAYTAHVLSDDFLALVEQVIPLVQCYLREWIPSIEVIGQELLIR